VTPHNFLRDFDPYRESVQTRAIAAAITEDMVRDAVATPPSQGIVMQQCIKRCLTEARHQICSKLKQACVDNLVHYFANNWGSQLSSTFVLSRLFDTSDGGALGVELVALPSWSIALVKSQQQCRRGRSFNVEEESAGAPKAI
jgi:hypothetical protein